VNYYSVNDTLWPMPFNVSNPVLYYNKAAFRNVGLDPEKPPGTFEELRAASQRIVDSSGGKQAGLALKIDAWYFEHWTAGAGQTYVNNGNGREARATEVTFDQKTGPEIFDFLSSMIKDRLAISTPHGQIDHYLAVANENAAMTIESSAGLGTVTQLLGSGMFPNVELGVGPMPGLRGTGGVLVGGAALYIMKRSSPAEQEAAWRFARFLNEPDVQAEWSAGTGYVPIRKSATTREVITKRWAEVPGFKVAYDQLVQGKESVATAGPVIGDYQGTRDAVIKAIESMFKSGTAPDTALKQAAKDSNEAIEEYNTRIGA
jgi:sn-glycerol 3-phosphate transport system substrate-binding protein